MNEALVVAEIRRILDSAYLRDDEKIYAVTCICVNHQENEAQLQAESNVVSINA